MDHLNFQKCLCLVLFVMSAAVLSVSGYPKNVSADEKETSDLTRDAAKYLFHPDPKKGEEGFEGMKKKTLDQIFDNENKPSDASKSNPHISGNEVEFVYADGNRVYLSDLSYGDKKHWPKVFSVYDTGKKKMVNIPFTGIAFIEYIDLAALNHPQYKYPSVEQRAKFYFKDGSKEILHLDRNWYAWKGTDKNTGHQKIIWQAGVRFVIFHPLSENHSRILSKLRGTEIKKAATNTLAEKGTAARGWLGISLENLNNQLKGYSRLEGGVYISNIFSGSPAEKAGLKIADIIVDVDGNKVNMSQDLVRIIANKPPGSIAEMKIHRHGDILSKKVLIGQRNGDVQAKASQQPFIEPGKAIKSKDDNFIAYEDGTVLDTNTGLMWAAKSNGSSIYWDIAYKYCKKYNGGGYNDWRLPTINELETLFDAGKSYYSYGTVHLTKLIRVQGGIWASNRLKDKALNYNFYLGRKNLYDSEALGQALPVRGPVRH